MNSIQPSTSVQTSLRSFSEAFGPATRSHVFVEELYSRL